MDANPWMPRLLKVLDSLAAGECGADDFKADQLFPIVERFARIKAQRDEAHEIIDTTPRKPTESERVITERRALFVLLRTLAEFPAVDALRFVHSFLQTYNANDIDDRMREAFDAE